ncbi:hypothetical protein GCM10028791_33920 [Echinicola sediminis]
MLIHLHSIIIRKLTFYLAVLLLLPACNSERSENKQGEAEELKKKEFFIVPGEDEPIDSALIQRGKVLISYADCYECHREESVGKGPSFLDIAKRYPNNKVYVNLLARKVISGGTGIWGDPVMPPHPKLQEEDAKAMAAYVLSFDLKQ